MDGPDWACVEGECLVSLAVSDGDTLEDVASVLFSLVYDDSVFTVSDAVFLNDALAHNGNVDFSRPDTISFMAKMQDPVSVTGPVAEIQFLVRGDAPIGVEAPIKYSGSSVFSDMQGGPVPLSFYDNHTVTILPNDTLCPQIDSSLVFFSQYGVMGMPGSVTDDWQAIPNDIQVELYDANGSQVAFAIADSVGRFKMDHFWLTACSQAKLKVWDLLRNSAELLFTVPQSYIPVVSAGSDTSGAAGDSIEVSFVLFNRCDLTETYDVLVHSAEEWGLDPDAFQLTLGSFTDTTLRIKAFVPSNLQNSTVDSITMVAISTTDPSSEDRSSLTIAGNPNVGVMDEGGFSRLPEAFSFKQNYPNPFNPETTIEYQLPKSCEVVISIYAINGEKIRDLFTGKKEAGNHRLTWQMNEYSSGIYIVRFEAENYVQMKKAILIK
jgi:hypothetical protein